MRSAEPVRRIGVGAAALMLAVLAGCSAMPWVKTAAPEPTEVPATAPASPAPEPTVAAAEPAPPTLAERAAAVLRAEAEVAPEVQRAFDAAREALRAGRIDEAERSFRALAAAHPELGGPHANLGLIYRQSGKLAQSATALEAAVKSSPKQATYANQLGITYRQQGEFNKAREAYESALDIDPGYAPAVLNLGILHDLYLWDAAGALALYERYVTLKPGGDAVVSKWIADLKNRKTKPITVSRKELP